MSERLLSDGVPWSQFSIEYAYSLAAFLILSYATMSGLEVIRGRLQDLLVLMFVLTLIAVTLFYVEPRLKRTVVNRKRVNTTRS